MTLKRKLSWRSIHRTHDDTALRIAILASFTAEPMVPFLGTGLHAEGIPARMMVAPYDQIVAQCVNPASETAAWHPDVIVVWPRLEDLWRGTDLPLIDPLDRYIESLLSVADAANSGAAAMKATLVFVLPVLPELLPLGVGDAGNARGVMAAAHAAREAARRLLAAAPGVLIADAEEVVRAIGSRKALDARTMTIARIPYTDACFAELSDRVARLLRIARRGAAKVAVVDADNTLWGGVVGEDGAAGIDLLDNGPGESYREFQRWLLELRRAGMLIAAASKNNEADVWDGFTRSEMVLRQEHLAAWRINWSAKSGNIIEMADELNLGLQSFVFIDDNPIELGEVAAAAPEVTGIRMPADPVHWKQMIAAVGALDRLAPTASDLGRAAAYQVESERRVLARKMTPEEYLASLGIEVRVSEPAPSDLGRLAQLVAKTNQFTLGSVRHSEAELAGYVTDPHYAVRVVSAVDRFGDYGVIGALIVALDAEHARLDTFVLSCRAMGRGVEEAMLCSAFEVAGQAPLSCTVMETEKNRPGRTFFARHDVTEPAVPTVIAPVSWPAHVTRR